MPSMEQVYRDWQMRKVKRKEEKRREGKRERKIMKGKKERVKEGHSQPWGGGRDKKQNTILEKQKHPGPEDSSYAYQHIFKGQ